MERYGDDLEVDFQREGLDLGQMIRGGKIRRILNFIDHLPQASHFYAAVSQDKEHVKALLEATKGQPPTPYHPPQSEFGLTQELLTKVVEAVQQATLAVIASAGAKPPKVKPLPRPASLVEDIKLEDIERKHEDLVRRILPGRSQGS